MEENTIKINTMVEWFKGNMRRDKENDNSIENTLNSIGLTMYAQNGSLLNLDYVFNCIVEVLKLNSTDTMMREYVILSFFGARNYYLFIDKYLSEELINEDRS